MNHMSSSQKITPAHIKKYFKLCSAAIGNKEHILTEAKARTMFGKVYTPLWFDTTMGKLVARETVIGGEDRNNESTSSKQKNYEPVLLF